MAVLMSWHPLRDLDQLLRRGESASPSAPRAALPLFVTDEDDHYLVRVEVPGVSLDDIELFLSDNVLTLKGEKTLSKGQESEGRRSRTLYSEIHYGAFERALELPEDIDPESIEATGRNGVLFITIGKARSEVRRIDIHGEEPAKVH